MRTMVALDDMLLKEAKRRAVGQGSTLSEVLDDALRQLLASPTRHERRHEKLERWSHARQKQR